MGTLVLGCAFALVVATAALVASCLRLPSPVGFLLAVYVLATVEIVAVALALSTVQTLTRPAVLAIVAGAFLPALGLWLQAGRPRPSPVGPALREALADRAVAVLAALAGVVHAYLLVVGLTVPQSLPDTLLYHLPRAALWMQQGAVAYVPDAPDERINAFPPIAEIEVLASMLLSGGERYVTLVQLFALAGACLAITGIARRLGLGRGAALFGALAFATFTVVALQTPTALNDLVVAALLAVCAYFALGSSRTELALSAAALALAVGTKGTVVFALPVLAAFVLASQPRVRRLSLVAAGAAGLAAGAFWYAVNLLETGDPRGSITFDQGSDGVTERIRLSFLDLFELSDSEGTELLASPLWGLGALVAACLLGGVLALRGRPGAGGTALLTGVLAFLAAPLLVTWVQVADRVPAHAAAAVGLASEGPASRLPEGFLESPMHSSYGLAFVVLFVGAGALVVSDVRNRRLPAAALVALAGVPATVLLTALALAYDPQRMRYVAFSVALAASVLGTALRIRPLAWASVVLAAATLAVSIAYFVPRPAGVALLPGNREPDRTARWFVQAESGAGDAEAFRFLAESVPADATVALDVASNTYLYPAWDAELRRTVVFVPRGGRIPGDAEWLVVGPSRPASLDRLKASGWRLELSSAGGWRILRRS